MNYIKKEDFGKICLNCLKRKENIKTIKIEPLAYGSLFDEWGTTIYLCEDCYNNAPENLKKLTTILDEDLKDLGHECLQYKGENLIYSYIESLPIEGQEVVFNRNKIDILFPENPVNPRVWIESQKVLESRKNKG